MSDSQSIASRLSFPFRLFLLFIPTVRRTDSPPPREEVARAKGDEVDEEGGSYIQ